MGSGVHLERAPDPVIAWCKLSPMEIMNVILLNTFQLDNNCTEMFHKNIKIVKINKKIVQMNIKIVQMNIKIV